MTEQVGGDHYKNCPIQPIEYIIKNKMDYAEGAVVKYVTRHKSKGRKQDLEKARDFLNKMIDNYDEWYPE